MAAATFHVVLVTAAPPGQTTEAGGPFTKIDGRESLLRAVELFLNRSNVRQIHVVFNDDDMEECKRKYGGHLSLFGVKLIGSPGPRWFDHVAAAAEKVAASDASHVIVHDAARPAVAYSDIDCVMAAAEKYAAVALTAPLRANLVELDDGHQPVAYHVSNRFVQLLTPQVYSKEKFAEVARTKQELHASGVHLEKGSPLNVRVAGSGDAGLVNTLIKMLPKPKIAAPNSPFEEAQW